MLKWGKDGDGFGNKHYFCTAIIPKHTGLTMMKKPIPAALVAALLLGAVTLFGSCHRRTATLTPAQVAYYTDTLNRLQRAAYTDPDGSLDRVDRLRDEGEAPTWKLDWVTATCHMVKKDRILAVHYFEQALASDSVQQNPHYYINLCRNLIEQCILLNRHEQALHYTRLFLERAEEMKRPDNVRALSYQFLSRIYLATGDTVSGLRAARTAIGFARRLAEERARRGADFQARPLYELAGQYGTLIACMLNTGRLAQAEAQIDTLADIDRRLEGLVFDKDSRPDGIPRNVVDDLRLELCGLRATLLLKQGKTAQARPWMDRLEEAADGGSRYASSRLAACYLDARRYADAVPLLRAQVEQLNRTEPYGNAALEACRQLTVALRSVGRQAEAWQYADRAAQIADTLGSRNNRNEVLQTTALYENKEKAARIASQQKELEQQRTLNLSLGALAVTLAVAIYLGYHTLRKTRRHNRAMAKRIHEETDANRRMAKRIDALMQSLVRRPLPPPGVTPVASLKTLTEQQPAGRSAGRNALELFNRLERLLKEEQLFKEQSLKREDLLERLGTNKDTLNSAVQQHAGKSVMAYLQSIRLEYAISLLEGTDKGVEEIAQEAGFVNVRSLQRAFKEEYNMTPTKYRGLMRK